MKNPVQKSFINHKNSYTEVVVRQARATPTDCYPKQPSNTKNQPTYIQPYIQTMYTHTTYTLTPQKTPTHKQKTQTPKTKLKIDTSFRLFQRL